MVSCSYRICTMSCAGARKGSHRREICKGLGGHKVVCNLNCPCSPGQAPPSQASTLIMGQHCQEEEKEEEEKKEKKVDMSDEEVRLALRAWPAEPDSVMEVSQDAIENAPEGMLNVWDLLTPFQQSLALTHPQLLQILPVNE